MVRRTRSQKPRSRLMVLFFVAILIIIVTAFIDYRYAIGQIILIFGVIGFFSFAGAGFKNRIIRTLESTGRHLDGGASFINSHLPVLVLRNNREIAWYNEAFQELTGHAYAPGKIISEAIEGFDVQKYSFEDLLKGVVVHAFGKTLKVYVTAIREGIDSTADPLSMIFFIDITQQEELEKEHYASRPVVGIIAIDNLDEISQNAKESEKAQVLGSVDNILHDFAAPSNGLLQMLERGKYLFIFDERHLVTFLGDKFSVLDNVREMPATVRVAPTISIGIGRGAQNYAAGLELATAALEMALSRGGDQVAIKRESGNYEFIGGKSKAVERRTKVKARVMANSLSELIDQATNVIVMGHKFADFDAVGASIGVARIVMTKNKPVNIVINRTLTPALPLLNHIGVMPEYADVFVDPIEGLDLISSNTLLIICDTHNPDILESREIYENAANVVVLDHHRRMANAIENTVLSYHEPYASSTSEIVCELAQYIEGGSALRRREAEAMLSGIVLDTNNFYFKTSFRTFEAAAYLKKMGADTIEVKKLFQVGLESYKYRTELITGAKIHEKVAAISIWSGELHPEYKVIMAQAADEMLSIEGVEASFVMCENAGVVHISSRSLGNVNVQLIMEPLGGGGHMTNAGTQIKTTIVDAYERLKDTISLNLKENFKKESI